MESHPNDSFGLIDVSKEESRFSWFGGFLCWLILAGIIVLLVHFSRFHPWLYERIAVTPKGFVVPWIVFLVIILFSRQWTETLWRTYQRLCDTIFLGYRNKPVRSFLVTFLAAGCLFWIFRIQRTDSGDILEWIMAGRQGKAFLVEHAPLETLIRCWISEILDMLPNADLLWLYKGLNCVYGSLLVAFLLRFSSKFPNPLNYLTPLFFLLTPALNIYFGYLEVYGASNLFQVIFLLMVIRFYLGQSSLWTVSFWYGMALAFGFWHVILFPAYGYLVWKCRKDLLKTDMLLQGLLLVVPTLLALVGLAPYANPFAGIITRMSEPSVLIPFSPYAQAQGYSLFSTMHLADWSSVMLLVSPVAFVLLVTRWVGNMGHIKRCIRHPVFVFAMIACAASWIFGFFYHPVLGLPLDWDLYTFMYPAFGMAGVVLMSDINRSRKWLKRFLVVVLLTAFVSSMWILQNNLFWRYPLLLTKLGPAFSPFVQDFYYQNMQKAFERNNQANLFWMADRALVESPERYRDILTFMDAWTISTLTKLPPLPFDYPGWACDLASLPGGGYRVLVFDTRGRIFLYNGQRLKWIFAPNEKLDQRVVAGDVRPNGSALLLSEEGEIYQVDKETLEQGIAGETVWKNLVLLDQIKVTSASKRDLPVQFVDVAIRQDGAIFAVDNFNRVWDADNDTLLMEGDPSYNLVQALHFTYNHQPITIDVNNRLSYDHEKVKLPFPMAWFHPIVRDFLFTPDERGMMILDLNGNIHYMGATSIYEDIVQAGAIVDRYEKMLYLPGRDALLLLDNRYRLTEAKLDSNGNTARRKISAMIEAGSYANAYNILTVLWHRSSIFTPVCYDLIDTDVIRQIPGSMMFVPEDAIAMYVDLLPVNDDLSVLIDRWGRLVAYNKGVLFLLEGTGIASWPRSEAVDGAYTDGKVFFLCRDGTVWQYAFQRFWGEQTSPFERTPAQWINLNDLAVGEHWIGIQPAREGTELVAVSEKGTLVRLAVAEKRVKKIVDLSWENKGVFAFDYRDTLYGFSLAYTSPTGPAYVYTSGDQTTREIPNSNFGWPVISDILFSKGDHIILLDRYGVVHQYDSLLDFSDKPYTAIMDAKALRILPSGNHALWMRSNGELKTIRLKPH